MKATVTGTDRGKLAVSARNRERRVGCCTYWTTSEWGSDVELSSGTRSEEEGPVSGGSKSWRVSTVVSVVGWDGNSEASGETATGGCGLSSSPKKLVMAVGFFLLNSSTLFLCALLVWWLRRFASPPIIEWWHTSHHHCLTFYTT